MTTQDRPLSAVHNAFGGKSYEKKNYKLISLYVYDSSSLLLQKRDGQLPYLQGNGTHAGVHPKNRTNKPH